MYPSKFYPAIRSLLIPSRKFLTLLNPSTYSPLARKSSYNISSSLNIPRRNFFSLPSFGPREFSDVKIVPFSQKQLYDLVSCVENYPKFLPFAQEAKIVKKITKGKDEEMEAELSIGFGGLSETYKSNVTCSWPGEITATSMDSNVFKELITTWKFTPVSKDETKVDFYIKFAFNNPLHAATADLVFDKVSGQIMDAFESRCQEVYGGKSKL